MLIHRRKAGEALLIGGSIEIRVLSVGKNVVLGIIAPREISVSARKISEVAMENTIASCHIDSLDRLIRGASRKNKPVVVCLDSAAPEIAAE